MLYAGLDELFLSMQTPADAASRPSISWRAPGPRVPVLTAIDMFALGRHQARTMQDRQDAHDNGYLLLCGIESPVVGAKHQEGCGGETQANHGLKAPRPVIQDATPQPSLSKSPWANRSQGEHKPTAHPRLHTAARSGQHARQ